MDNNTSPAPMTEERVEELIARLRHNSGIGTLGVICEQAADALQSVLAYRSAEMKMRLEAEAELAAERARSAELVEGIRSIVNECSMSREQFMSQGPAFACGQVERAVSMANALLDPNHKADPQ